MGLKTSKLVPTGEKSDACADKSKLDGRKLCARPEGPLAQKPRCCFHIGCRLCLPTSRGFFGASRRKATIRDSIIKSPIHNSLLSPPLSVPALNALGAETLAKAAHFPNRARTLHHTAPFVKSQTEKSAKYDSRTESACHQLPLTTRARFRSIRSWARLITSTISTRSAVSDNIEAVA
jgi:hypothetical protein